MFSHVQIQQLVKSAEQQINYQKNIIQNLNQLLEDQKRKNNYLRNKLRKSETDRDKIRKKYQNIYYDLDKEREHYLCQICCENPRNFIIEPCHHFFCSQCATSFDECPNCRGTIHKFIEVFY